MTLLLFSLALIAGTGILSGVLGRWNRFSVLLGVGGSAGGCLVGLIPAVRAVLRAPAEAIDLSWSLPGGALSFTLDPLSGLFLVAVLALGGLAAVYGAGYFQPTESRPEVGMGWLWFNILIASMVVVVTARNAVLFLLAWEIMTISSYFLVTWDDSSADTRRAGWTYLVAAHIGTAFLILFFTGLARSTGGFDLAPGIHVAPAHAGLLFLAALVGFGTKAGFVPLHVWLPEAHPAAPSHVSAVMSGVMIKMGIYGLLRALTMLGPWQAWWGWVLLAVGLVSGLLGVLNALAQQDLKRLLAYSTVENLGIIAMALGLGVIAETGGYHGAAVLVFMGGLIHVVNHALFKGLLFFGAGSVLHGAGTRKLDELGQLIKRMPETGMAFVAGSAAVSGLPPFNGFVGEFLIFLGAIQLLIGGHGGLFFAGIAGVAGLGMIGALATACFARVVGVVFLGNPRTGAAEKAHESSGPMLMPMVVLAVLCSLGGVAAPLIGRIPVGSLGVLLPATVINGVESFYPADSLAMVAVISGFLFLLVALLAWFRSRLLRNRSVTESATWGCGYLDPSARMQYTASSFAHPLVSYFNLVLGVREKKAVLSGYFPREDSFGTESRDLFVERLFAPLMSRLTGLLDAVRGIQEGHVQLYIAYIAATLVILLFMETWQ